MQAYACLLLIIMLIEWLNNAQTLGEYIMCPGNVEFSI